MWIKFYYLTVNLTSIYQCATYLNGFQDQNIWKSKINIIFRVFVINFVVGSVVGVSAFSVCASLDGLVFFSCLLSDES